MNQVVIFFVPTGVSQRDFEAALREHSAALPIGEPPPPTKIDRSKITDNDLMPLWKWFIPDVCR